MIERLAHMGGFGARILALLSGRPGDEDRPGKCAAGEDGTRPAGVRRMSQVSSVEGAPPVAIGYSPESPLCLPPPQCLGAFRATDGQVGSCMSPAEGLLASVACVLNSSWSWK